MIMCGKNITSVNDPLVKVPVEYVYNSLIHPKADVDSLIRQLRTLYVIDPKRYAAEKRRLPYLVCGMFKPEFRRRDNFTYIDRFIVDLDHLSEKGKELEALRLQLSADPRVLLCFLSPSEDGLKVMFKLKERCCDYGLYSLFYKEFITRFSAQYGLEQVVDRVTSDVSRACFVSCDPKAWYNPDCEPVDMDAILPSDNPVALFDLKHDYEEEMQQTDLKSKSGGEPDDDVLAKIKQRLGTGRVTKAKKEAYVPQNLMEITQDIAAYIQEQGIQVTGVVNIQYGQKFQGKLGLRLAEVNVFYGRRGFSVVVSPKSGTDEELNAVMARIVEQYLYADTGVDLSCS